MTILEAIVLGVVQGITEFLPISSSGHLIVLKDVFAINESSYTFDVAVHIATLLAVLWVLRGDIGTLLRELKDGIWKQSLVTKIVVATVPVVIVGLWLSGGVIDAIRTTQIAAWSLIVWGVVLYGADVFARRHKKQVKKIQKITWLQSIVVGCAQVVSLIPGTSRSGITMTAGLFAGLDRVRAAKLSFLLSIPALAGAGVLTFLDAWGNGLDVSMAPLVIGFLAALVTGVLVAQFLLRFLQKGSFAWFAMYRIALGVVILIFLA